MSMLPFRGRCQTCGHDHNKELEALQTDLHAQSAVAIMTTDLEKEREALCPRYEAWKHLAEHGTWPDGVPDWARETGSGRVNMHLAAHLVIEELGAALADPAAHSNGATISDYEEVLADHRRLVRELDVLLNGEEGAAPQASLGDIVAQVRKEGIKAAPAVPQSVPSFNARQISLKQRGAKIVLTLELDAIEGAPQYIVTPINPSVVRPAAPSNIASDTLKSAIKPRPVNGVLDDYWQAMGGEGPQAFQWKDKPHRLVYDLIANVLFYASASSPQEQPSDEELQESRQFILNAAQLWADQLELGDTARKSALAAFSLRIDAELSLISRYGTAPQGDIQAMLKDPIIVHRNMCHGTIAPVTFDQLAHVLGDDAKREWLAKQAAPQGGEDARPCTCHPDDRPKGSCRQKYAASECHKDAQPAGRDAREEDTTRCSNALRKQGKAYPRTCRECGLGPCKFSAQGAAA